MDKYVRLQLNHGHIQAGCKTARQHNNAGLPECIVVGYVTSRPWYAFPVRTERVLVPGTRTQVYSSQEAICDICHGGGPTATCNALAI